MTEIEDRVRLILELIGPELAMPALVVEVRTNGEIVIEVQCDKTSQESSGVTKLILDAVKEAGLDGFRSRRRVIVGRGMRPSEPADFVCVRKI